LSSIREQVVSAERKVRELYRGDAVAVRLALMTLLSRGHLLIEDVPGIGKTTLALALAGVFDLQFRRVQMTSDLLPADLIGVSVYEQDRGAFRFQPGPIFTQVLLVDELNRATPKTQSALLEAMAEGAVSVEGVPEALPEPYLVVATQNPVEQVGTFPLPESQLDRFLMRIQLGYPDAEREVEMLKDFRYGDRNRSVTPLIESDGVLAAQKAAAQVALHDDIVKYLLSLVRATREHPELAVGVSPRGSLALAQAARTRAWLDGRGQVIPDDIYALAVPVLAHRIMLRGDHHGSENELSRLQESLLTEILESLSVPV